MLDTVTDRPQPLLFHHFRHFGFQPRTWTGIPIDPELEWPSGCQSIGSTPCCLSFSRPSCLALSPAGGCPCQSTTSPMTRSGSRERYDLVGLPGNFLSVRLGSFSIPPIG